MGAAPGPSGGSPRRETTAVPAAPESRSQDDLKARAQIAVRLTWLMLFRAVVTTVLLATALILRATSVEPMFERAAVVLYAVAGVSYGAILAGALWLRQLGDRRVVGLAYSQLFFDAAVMTVLVVLTGGVESVFAFAFSLTVLNGAAVLGRRGARVLAGAAALLFSIVMTLEVMGVGVPWASEVRPTLGQLLPAFLTNTASFVLVAILGGYLTEQLQRASERLDVTQAQMARLEELYLAVLESLPSGVLTVDAGERIVYVNEAGAEILGTAPRELVGQQLPVAAPALEPAGVAENARFERVATVSDRERTIGGTVARLVGLEGVAGRVIVYQDLTELRRLQLDVARAERLAELGRFAAGLAHEIRNPLAAMIGCLQLLRSDAQAAARDATSSTSPEARAESERMLGIVQREAERLSGLVTAFLTYARPAPPVLEDVPVLAAARDTVATLQAGLDAGVEIVVEGAEVAARCDAGQLRQVLWNLVGNAVQAVSGAEQGPGRVRVRVRREDVEAVVTVEDSGPGVPADIRPRIFEPFFTTRPAGTGLGLATVHQVLAQQGGTITLGDSPLGGASFTVRLPTSDAPALDGAGASGSR